MAGTLTLRQVNRDLLKNIVTSPARIWYILLGIDLVILTFGAYCWAYQIRDGLGVTGLTHPVGWGIYITNFVFWVGIAHSGTLISAVLFLFRARWRTSIARSAEAMTIFAVMTAGLFPIIHIGRAWNFYWLLPYPNQRQLWVNFQSPLVWDAFAITTYFAVSFMFWYIGLIPDLAAARDRTQGLRRRLYDFFSLGWSGTDGQWHHYLSAYGLFAALATPLVVSVHSVVSWDFAMSIVPGWHSTIFAPYFVAGAIFSGLAMVLTLLIPLRKIFGLESYITPYHFDNLGKMIICTSLILTYSYASEFFIAWYSNNPFEQAAFWYRATGDYAALFWLMLACNCAIPLLLCRRTIRTHTVWLFIISLLINIGMWLERFVIIVTSLAHEFDPAAWGLYQPSWVEVGITVGSFAWFFLFFLFFVKFLPVVSLSEVKEQISESNSEDPGPEPTTIDAPNPSPPEQLTFQRPRVVGVFDRLESVYATLRSLKQSGYKNVSIVSPVGNNEMGNVLGRHKSPIRYFTLAGALFGCLIGFALPIYTALDWPLQTSAKPIVALPAFAVIAFELTILFGALATLLGFLVQARLPSRKNIVSHDGRFTEDRYGLRVPCTLTDIENIKASMQAAGADDIYIQETP